MRRCDMEGGDGGKVRSFEGLVLYDSGNSPFQAIWAHGLGSVNS